MTFMPESIHKINFVRNREIWNEIWPLMTVGHLLSIHSRDSYGVPQGSEMGRSCFHSTSGMGNFNDGRGNKSFFVDTTRGLHTHLHKCNKTAIKNYMFIKAAYLNILHVLVNIYQLYSCLINVTLVIFSFVQRVIVVTLIRIVDSKQI